MPKLSEVFSGSFLKAEDLKGRNVPVIIETVEVKEFDDGKKLVLHFRGKDKCLVCNKTNASIISELLGSDDTDEWEGKGVVLTTKKVEFQGKLVPAIRVMLEPPSHTPPPAPKPKAPEPDLDMEGADIPF